MLRHIISVSLAMAACATLIPIKASAVTLTLIPVNGLQRERGDEMKFLLSLNPFTSESDENFTPGSKGTYVRFQGIAGNWNQDERELSRRGKGIEILIERGNIITSTTTIAIFTFDVLQPEKDGKSDLLHSDQDDGNSVVAAIYEVPFLLDNGRVEKWSDIKGVVASDVVDVVPVPDKSVPEPLTIFGAATALGYGAILKRKSSKKKVS